MEIDFSSKHDVLIRLRDGSLIHMDEPHYEIELIAPDTWMIISSGDNHYLLAGDDEGIAIDTGYGAGNLREYLESVSKKPVPCAINTHHHFDHTANNGYFNKVYMAAESVPLATIPYPSFDGITFPRDFESIVVGDGYVINLKGRALEIFCIGDHTDGGIAILDRKERLLFTGDEINPSGKMIDNSVESFKKKLEKIMIHRFEFDRICGGGGISDASLVDDFYNAMCNILAGEIGEQVELKKLTFPAEPKGPNGETVYGYNTPRPEDAPTRINGEGRKNVRQYMYKGMSFKYTKLYDDANGHLARPAGP